MECVAAKAFKTKFWPETTTSATPFKPIEDFWVGAASNHSNGVVDEFLVDEFLDFSKDEQHESQEPKQEQEEIEEYRDYESVSSQEQNLNPTHDFSQKSHLGSEITVPTDEMADLEWLSHFVDDSFSEFDSTAAPPQFPGPNRVEPGNSGSFHPVQVPARPRTKRSRTGSRVRPNTTAVTATSTVTTVTATTTTTTTPTSSSASSSSTSCLIFKAPGLEILEGVGPTAAKRQRRNLGAEALSARRCSHCGSQKTPQWRAGPRGAKTLCNACGVRFKSGRLLPEYRPACSPTFSSEIHSNSHRKVLEMRRKKEVNVATVEAGVAPAVRSF